jgi:hypothetical protein
MSDETLAPTASNFDAVIAANEAKLSAKEAPDTTENDDVSEIEDADVEEVEEEPESKDDDESEDEADDEESEDDDDPTTEPVEPALKAPFKAFREVLKTKQATPEFLAAIGDVERVIQTVNGPIRMKYSEMDGHVMREARFGREMAKTKEDQAKAHHIMQTHQALTNAWRQSPQELARGLQIYGCQEALNVLHRQWAEETYAFLNASPQEQQRIQQLKQERAQRAQEQQQFYAMQQKLKQYEQQTAAQQFDEPTKQAGDYIHKNMDSVLSSALKSANAGRISDPARQTFVDELTALAQQGLPLPEAMKEAAAITADRYREQRELAQASVRAAEKKKPKEVSGKRAPAGNAPPKRDGDGRFQPPSRSSNGKRSKTPPTAASFGERFGV